VEDTDNYLGETKLRWLGSLKRMDETSFVKRVREEKNSKTYEERKTEKVLSGERGLRKGKA